MSTLPGPAPGTAPIDRHDPMPPSKAHASGRTALLRFALGLLAVAIVVALAELYVVVGFLDLPDNSRPSRTDWTLGLTFVVGFAVGWVCRGAGVLGLRSGWRSAASSSCGSVNR